MDDRICSQGHVVDRGKERCTRCNGFPVVDGAAVDPQAALLEQESAVEPAQDAAPEVVGEGEDGESPKAEEAESLESSDGSSVDSPNEGVKEPPTEDAPANESGNETIAPPRAEEG